MINPTTLLLDQIRAVVGTTGSGKTYAAKSDVELLLARKTARVCVVDPLGVWWGLRLRPDGKTPAYNIFVMGGSHGDIPITDDMGARVGKLVATRDFNVVIDLSAMKSGASRRRFMTAFADTLYEENARPLHLILDEADLWAPQKPRPEQAALLGLIDEIVRRGRVKGFIPWLITQRPAVLNKDVLSQAQTLVAMQVTGTHDREAIAGWIKGVASREEGRAVDESLPNLARGEGWVWSPRAKVLQLVTFPKITTYDSSRTPEPGEKVSAVALPPIDMAGLAAALKPVPKEEPELKGKDAKVTASLLKEARQAGYDAGYKDGYGAGDKDARVAAVALQEQAGKQLAALRAILGYAAPFVGRENGIPVIDVRSACPADIEAIPHVRQSKRLPAPRPSAPGGLTGSGPGLLATIAAHHPARLTWGQIASLSGRKARGGHFNAGRKALRDGGYISEADDRVILEPAGIAAAGAVEAAPKDKAGRIEMWCRALPSPAPDMLRRLDALGGDVTVARLALSLNRKPLGGHWNGGIANLRSNGLIKVEGDRLMLTGEIIG